MANIPLPKGYSGVDDQPKIRESIINLLPVDNGYVRTPGISSIIASAGAGCRGATTWEVDEKAYFVLGTTLYRLESGLTLTNLGTVSGLGQVYFSKGQIYLVILAKDGSAYSYDSTNGLQQITDPSYTASSSVDFINGRHWFIPTNGNPAIYSNLEDAADNAVTIDGFIDAQQLPDKNKHCVNIKNKLVIFGASSGEWFSIGSDEALPLVPMTGTRMDTGYVGGGIKYKNTFVFIGRDEGQTYGFYIVAGHGETRLISNAAIMEDLTGYTYSEVENAKVDRFTWFNRDCIAWTISDRTYCFYGEGWIFLDSDLNGSEDGPWRARGVTFAYGKYYCGDRATNNIGSLTDTPSEYGSDIEYQFQTFFRTSRNDHFQVGEIELDCLTGQGSATVGISLSKDARVWSDYSYRSIGPTGNYDARVRWAPSGGCGAYESFMGIRARGTGQVKFSLEALRVGVE